MGSTSIQFSEFRNKKILITGASTGIGAELAKAFTKLGFETTLISGPTNLKELDNVKTIKVKTAKEMYEATINSLPVDVAIFSAAVSDWKMKNFEKNKIKSESTLNISLEKNVDILKSVSNHNSLRPKIVVGFAAETENLISNSKKKFQIKKCDWMIANKITEKYGFKSDKNKVFFIENNLINILPNLHAIPGSVGKAIDNTPPFFSLLIISIINSSGERMCSKQCEIIILSKYSFS